MEKGCLILQKARFMRGTGPRARRKAMESSSTRLAMFTRVFSKEAKRAVKGKNSWPMATTIEGSLGRVS